MQDMDMINEELKAKFLAGECTEEELLQIKKMAQKLSTK